MNDREATGKASAAERDLLELLRRTLPARDLHEVAVEAVEEGEIRLRFPFRPGYLGPGEIFSGPLLLSFADTAIYAAVQVDLPEDRIALTSTLNVSFLRPAQAQDVVALSRVLRRGRRIAHAEAWLFSYAATDPILHATASCVLAARPI
ncbi:MAG: PaaI family thioesterase [Reyranellaceae bacterium]